MAGTKLKPARLTARQESFARHVFGGMSLIDSYQAAGYSQRQTNAARRTNASLLMTNTNILQTIEGWQAAKDRSATALSVSDKDLVLTEIRKHVKTALPEDSNKIRAIELLGRTVPGLFKGEEATAPERTAAEIRAELAEYMARIDSDNVIQLAKLRKA